MILSVNLRRLMDKHPDLSSQSKLGKRAKIAGRSVGYMLQPSTGNPTIDNIAKVAAVFGLDVWQLMHPDIPARAMGPKEEAMYEAIRRSFAEIKNGQ